MSGKTVSNPDQKERILSSCPSEQVTCFGQQAQNFTLQLLLQFPGEWCLSPGSARSSLGRTSCRQLGQCSDTFQPLLRQFLPATNVTEAVGPKQSGILPAKSRLPQHAFSRTGNTSERERASGMSVVKGNLPVLRGSRICLGEKRESQCGRHLLLVGRWVSDALGVGGELAGRSHAGPQRT